ncbi:hypothetical protein [Actinoallomurus soli]|uniref:hypothetical protein n=1 Tax=Actinoallomurus soli TaxID=2952535 RepID=UPI00209236AD|nr:hypothetical protein [Actinoallomurus soli]MCO5968319.1 hypothetical protein [Actinoallomurus soli]
MADVTWRCSSCETYNDANAGVCMVCDTQRGRSPADGDSGPTWRCRQCDVWNEADRNSCQGCDTKRTLATEPLPGRPAPGPNARGRVRGPSWNLVDPSAVSTPPVPPVPAEPPGTGAATGWTRSPGADADAGLPHEFPPVKPYFPGSGTPYPITRPPGGRKSSKTLVGMVTAAVIVVVVLIAALSARGSGGPSGGPTGTPTETSGSPSTGGNDASPVGDSGTGEEQASTVDALLSRSSTTRSNLRTAIDGILDCSDVDGGVSTLRSITDDRRSELADARGLSVDGIDGGTEMKDKLVQALKDSLAADEAFLSWAEDTQTNGCDGNADVTSDYRRGESASSAAGDDKTAFIGLWNPIADRYHLDRRTPDDV